MRQPAQRPPAATPAAPLAAGWRRAGFGRLLGTRLTSLAADGLFSTSLASAVFFTPERATTAGQAAAGFAVLLLPYSVVSPFAGVLLDRWRRARVLVWANLLRALLVVAVAGLLAAHGPAGALFFMTALVAVSVNRFHSAATAASLPHVVVPDRLVTANAVWTVWGIAAGLAGGGLGLVIRAAGGAGDGANASAAAAAATVYAGSALLAAGFAAGSLGPDSGSARADGRLAQAAGQVLRDLSGGARAVAGRRPVAAALVAIGAHRFLYGISTIATLLLYRNYFTDDGWLRAGIAGAAQVVVAAAVGSVIAAAITPAVVRRWSVRGWVILLLATAAAVEVVLGLPYRMGPLLAAAVLFGVVAQAMRICVDTVVQQHMPDGVRGRAFAFYDTLFNVMFVAAAAVAALALPDSGRSYPVLAFIACGYAVTAVGYAAATRSR